MFKYSRVIARLSESMSALDLELATKAQSGIWRYLGLATVIFILSKLLAFFSVIVTSF